MNPLQQFNAGRSSLIMPSVVGGGRLITRDLTLAELRSLNTAPITLATPGVNGLIGVASWWITMQTTVAFSAAPILSLRFAGLAYDPYGTWSSAMNGINRRWFFADITAGANSSAPPVGGDLQIRSTADVTLGGIAYAQVGVFIYNIPTFRA